MADRIAEIANGAFKYREPPEIKGSGYVVESLEAALWAFDRSQDFREGALMAVNLGDDADTTGAIYGQIAGAYYGVKCNTGQLAGSPDHDEQRNRLNGRQPLRPRAELQAETLIKFPLP